MAKVGKLNVQLTASSRGLARGLGHGTRLIRGFAATNTMLIGGLTGTFGKLAGIVGIGGVGAAMAGATVALKKGADAVDNLAKQSQKLLGTRNTGALAGIRHAADDAGVPVASLEKGMEKLADTLVKAGRGEKASVEAFKRIGLSARELKRLRPEEQLGLVADRLGALGDTGEKISFARGIFGRSGADLVGLFDAGSEGIAAATEEMRLFGFAIKDVDAFGVEAANDAIGKLKKIGEGVAMQFAVQFAPVIEAVTMKLVDLIKASNGVGAAVENAFNQGIEFTAGFLDKVEDLRMSWLRLRKTVYETAAAMARGIFGAGRAGGSEAEREAELQKRAAMVPEHRREEFIRRAREAGGFQDERVHFGRVGDAFAEQASEVDTQISEAEKSRREKGSLGSRFKDFIYEAQTSALERAENALLEQEQKITDEMREQKQLREQSAGLDTGFIAFGGPVFQADEVRAKSDAARAALGSDSVIDGASIPGERGKRQEAGAVGNGEVVTVLNRIDSKLGRGVPVVYA